MDRTAAAAFNGNGSGKTATNAVSGGAESALKLQNMLAATSDYSSSLTISSTETTSNINNGADQRCLLAINTQPATKLEQIDNILLNDGQMMNGGCSGADGCNLDSMMGSSSAAAAATNTPNVASLGILMLSKPFSSSSTFINNANRAIANTTLEGERKILSLRRSISEKLRNSLKNTNNVSAAIAAGVPNATAKQPPTSTAEAKSQQQQQQQQHTIEPRKWHSERYRQNAVVSPVAAPAAPASPSISTKYSINAPLNAQCMAILAQYANKAKQEQQLKQQQQAAATAPSTSSTLNEKANISKLSKTNRKFSRITIKKKASRTAETTAATAAIAKKHPAVATAKKHADIWNFKSVLSGREEQEVGGDDDDDETDTDTDSYHSYGHDMIRLSESDSDDSSHKPHGAKLMRNYENKRHHTTPIDDTDDDDREESSETELTEELLRDNLCGDAGLNLHHHRHRHASAAAGRQRTADAGAAGDLLTMDSLNLNDIINIDNDNLGSLANMTLRLTELTHRIFNENATATGQTLVEQSASYFYERISAFKSECQICFEQRFLNERQCCHFQACNLCINTYIETQIKQCYGVVRIECLNSKCNKLIHRDEITERMAHFDSAILRKYLQFLIDANKDSNCKTCPRCSHVMKLESSSSSSNNNNSHFGKSHCHHPAQQLQPQHSVVSVSSDAASAATTKSSQVDGTGRNASLKNRLLSKLKGPTTGFPNSPTKVQCIECQLIWCFNCHAPWHDGIGCSEFKKGDKMLKYWAKELHYGQQNAQLCPKCKIYIQRTKGCDHMVCTLCLTEFCYKCGGKFHRVKFVGDHYSRLSVLGCKYKFYPEKPLKRKIIRGSILSGKIVAAPLVASLALVAGLGILMFGCVALPIYGSYRLAKHVKSVKIKKAIGKNLKNALSSETIEVHTKNVTWHHSTEESNTNLSHISVPNNNESNEGLLDNHSSSLVNQAANIIAQSTQNLTATAAATNAKPLPLAGQLTKRAKSQCLVESCGSSDSAVHDGGSFRTRSKSSEDVCVAELRCPADQIVPLIELSPSSTGQKSVIVSAIFRNDSADRAKT